MERKKSSDFCQTRESHHCSTCQKSFANGEEIVRFVIRFFKDDNFIFKEIFVCNERCSYNFMYKNYNDYVYPQIVKISDNQKIKLNLIT